MNHPNPATERLAPGTALEHLLAAEWDHPNWRDACPVCEQPKIGGKHSVDCRLAHAINALAPIPQPPDLVTV